MLGGVVTRHSHHLGPFQVVTFYGSLVSIVTSNESSSQAKISRKHRRTRLCET
jgi:hypothetical protein